MSAYDFLVKGDVSDESVALVDPGGRSWLYEDLRILVEHLSGFIEESTYVQDRCLIHAENGMFWVCCYLATLRTGRIAVPVPVDAPPSHLERIIQSCTPRVAFVDQRRLSQMTRHKTERLVIVSEESAEDSAAISWGEALAFLPCDHTRKPAPATVAALMYGLNAQGQARAVMHTHGNITSSTDMLVQAMSTTPADRVMSLLPLTHSLGLAVMHMHLRRGACIVLDTQRPNPARILTRIRDEGCTGLWATPHTLQLMLAHAPAEVLPNLRYIQQAGGRLPAAALMDLHHALPGKQLYCIYSEPEASGAIAMLSPALADVKPESVGKPLPGIRVELVTPGGKTAKPGEVGRMLVDGPSVAAGYWGQPLQAHNGLEPGHLDTGDLATIDNEGYLQIAGNDGEQIKLGDGTVQASQIEQIVSLFPGITDAAAFTRPDEILGDAVVLVVVHPRGEEVRQQLTDFCASRLPFNQRPREIQFRAQLPRNESGLVDRTMLRDETATARRMPSAVEQMQVTPESLPLQ